MHLAPLILKDIADSFLPVGMATLLEGEGELVLPAVPGFLWSHLENAMYGISISKELLVCSLCAKFDINTDSYTVILSNTDCKYSHLGSHGGGLFLHKARFIEDVYNLHSHWKKSITVSMAS